MRTTLVAILGLALVAPVVGYLARADAGTQFCGARAPQTANEFQAVSDARSAAFGAGDLMSMTDLPDGRRFFVFGDTSYFDVTAGGGAGPLAGFGNNSAWVQSGGCFTQLDNSGGDRSWIQPAEQDGSVYWPGASVVVGNRLHVLLTRLYLDNMWGTPIGSAVATFELPSLELARIAPVPFDGRRVFGSGAVYDGGYLYSYGSARRDCPFCFAGDVYVARVPEDQVQVPSAWQYFAGGGGWSTSALAAVPVIPEAASNTNVQPWRNGFLLVTKPVAIVGPDVDAWWSPDPVGPWQRLGTIYHVPVPPPARRAGYTYHDAFSYTPTVSTSAAVDGGLLMGYNVLSFDLNEGIIDGRGFGPRFVSVQIPNPPAVPARVVVAPTQSPWEAVVAVDRRGRVHAVGGSVSYPTSHTNTAVGVASTVTGRGSWAVARDGGVFSVGDAQFYGSTGGMRLNQPVVGIASTPTGRGYWLVAQDGGVFSFGDAQFHGSTGGMRLNKPILGMAATASGRGYWLIASDGGVFSFGDANFYGSTGSMRLQQPVVDLAPSPSGRGYYLVTLDGSIYAFGDAPYHGNAPSFPFAFTVGVSPVPGGYRIVDTLGRVTNLGGARGPTLLGPSDAPYIGVA